MEIKKERERSRHEMETHLHRLRNEKVGSKTTKIDMFWNKEMAEQHSRDLGQKVEETQNVLMRLNQVNRLNSPTVSGGCCVFQLVGSLKMENERKTMALRESQNRVHDLEGTLRKSLHIDPNDFSFYPPSKHL